MKKIVLTVFMSMFAITAFIPGAYALSELDNRIWEANEVLKEYMSIPEKRIPPRLLQKAQAIAIFPTMVKGGFVVAGQYGRGIVIRKDPETGEWSAPAFFRISGGSIGFQIGAQASDAILVITTERGVRGLLQNKFTLGGDASVAAGPAGRDAEAKTDWKMKSTIYSYSRSKGLFAGVSLDGMVINQEKDDNAAYYGEATTAEDILFSKAVVPSAEGQKLITSLNQFAS